MTLVQAMYEDTPEEALESANWLHQESLASDLLDRIVSCSPTFFEKLVVELLVAMGYGGSMPDAGKPLVSQGMEELRSY
ncbi:MAG: hypothetical protein R3C11_01560 [Planctomycetaceae bacterium]